MLLNDACMQAGVLLVPAVYFAYLVPKENNCCQAFWGRKAIFLFGKPGALL